MLRVTSKYRTMKNQKKTKYLLLCSLIFIALIYGQGIVQATVVGTEVNSQLGAFAGQSGAGFARPEDPRIVIGNIIGYVMGFLGILSLGYTLYAGYTIMTSGGNQDKVDKGKMMIRNGTIGLLLILSAFAITKFVVSSLTNANRPPLRGLDGDFTTDGSQDFRFCDQPNRPPGLNCPGRQNQ